MRFELGVAEYLRTGQLKVVKICTCHRLVDAQKQAEAFSAVPPAKQIFHVAVRDKKLDYANPAAIVLRIGDESEKAFANALRWEFRGAHGPDWCGRSVVGEAVA